jgi:hypothetical protein
MRAWNALVMAVLMTGSGVGALALARPPARASEGALQAQAGCQVGAAPTQSYGARPPEQFLRYRTRPVVIGCPELASGRRFELVGYQLGRPRPSFLCIDHYDFATGVTWGCGSNLVFGGGAIDATSTSRSGGQTPVVAGTMSSPVARVVVRSEIRGRLRRHPAAIVRVRGRKLLRAIGVSQPFGRYLAEVPPGARAASAEAFGAHGRSLGLALFPGFRGPVGQARRCYTQPQVRSMRLLEPARVGRTSRVRVVAVYPRGQITSVELTVAGKGSVRAEISGADGGRVVIALPVRFTRRGTLGVDGTVEGLPLSKLCGKRPALRRSQPSAVAVRVR